MQIAPHLAAMDTVTEKDNVMLLFRKDKKESPGNSWLFSLNLVPGKTVVQILMKASFRHLQDRKAFIIVSCRILEAKLGRYGLDRWTTSEDSGQLTITHPRTSLSHRPGIQRRKGTREHLTAEKPLAENKTKQKDLEMPSSALHQVLMSKSDHRPVPPRTAPYHPVPPCTAPSLHPNLLEDRAAQGGEALDCNGRKKGKPQLL
ncbi:hypothetical protein QYF61_023580 [Mycteria americana]|uniref:Uncharacterized protein n=1 Tax=Mycteria americana TaxID=33587 RepID=A0AAN7NV89_MYCAM|nr:hypothetical protein QYF61_023580 [Mycteria americana]